MRFGLSLLLLAGVLPSLAQINVERFRSFRQMPPEIVINDAVRLAPESVRIEIDNPSTRVLRITLAPSRRIPSHDDRAGVLVCLSECHLRLIVEGQSQELHLRTGQTHWMKEDERAMLNIGSNAAEMLYIENKKPQN